jgi:hypothetical protein
VLPLTIAHPSRLPMARSILFIALSVFLAAATVCILPIGQIELLKDMLTCFKTRMTSLVMFPQVHGIVCPDCVPPFEKVPDSSASCGHACLSPVNPACPDKPINLRKARYCGGTSGKICPAITCVQSISEAIAGPNGKSGLHSKHILVEISQIYANCACVCILKRWKYPKQVMWCIANVSLASKLLVRVALQWKLTFHHWIIT